MNPKSILLIEDEHALGSALSLLVTRLGHRAELVASAAAGLTALEKHEYDAAVIDIGLPDQSGLEVLESIRKNGSTMPVLVITAHATLEHAVKSHQQGATAYMNKPLDLAELKQQLSALLETGQSVALTAAGPDSMDPVNLIGAAACLRDVFVGIARASSGAFPVLIFGPGGSGKSLAAKLIHKHGNISSGQIHELDCASLKEWKPHGDWDGGCVILNDLESMDENIQRSLSDWLQSQDEANFRLMATMRMDPSEAVGQGGLREELHFVFKPGCIQMPSLQERSSDIPALCHYFSALESDTRQAPEITPAVMSALQSHDWPGNVRELKHVLHYAISMSQGGPLFLSHLPESIVPVDGDSNGDAHLGREMELSIQRWLDDALNASQDHTYDELLQMLESQLLHHLMQHFDGMPTRLAEALKIHRSTLRQKLLRVGWEKPAKR